MLLGVFDSILRVISVDLGFGVDASPVFFGVGFTVASDAFGFADGAVKNALSVFCFIFSAGLPFGSIVKGGAQSALFVCPISRF